MKVEMVGFADGTPPQAAASVGQTLDCLRDRGIEGLFGPIMRCGGPSRIAKSDALNDYTSTPKYSSHVPPAARTVTPR